MGDEDGVDVDGTLQKAAFFSLLSKEDMDVVTKAMTSRTVAAGEQLAQEGAPQKEAFLVVRGSLEKIRQGEEVTLLKSGALAGMLHLLTEDPCYATLKAAEDSEVLVLSSSTFHELLRSPEHKNLSEAYLHFLSKQLRAHSKALNKLRGKLWGGEATQAAKLRVAFFDNKAYMQAAFTEANKETKFDIQWFHTRLLKETANLASGCPVVCCFVNDNLDADVIKVLKEGGVNHIAMRCAGYDNVDLDACKQHGITVTRVPAYSPNAVAEFAVTLMLTLNRKVHKAYNRVRDFNFSLKNMVGFDMNGKTVGLLGAGQIGKLAARILLACGCKVLVYDIKENEELKQWGARYASKDEVISASDIISLHTPLLPSTKHMINEETLNKMKQGVMIINTGRGGLIDSHALLKAIQTGRVGSAGLDVYEGEKAYFFENRSTETIRDNVLAQLISSPNVIVTSHQAFLTHEALANISSSTIESIKQWESGTKLTNEVRKE